MHIYSNQNGLECICMLPIADLKVFKCPSETNLHIVVGSTHTIRTHLENLQAYKIRIHQGQRRKTLKLQNTPQYMKH